MKNKSADKNNKGQAVVELAIFGSLILFLFGILLSNLQRFNDQQYVQMEAFRRALEKACTQDGETVDGAGASVQLTLIQNRRHIDMSGSFKKGNPQALSASSSVFWAVPKLGEKAKNLITFRINENETTHDYREFVKEGEDRYDDKGNERQTYKSFEIDDIDTKSDTEFNETSIKQENPKEISTTRSSTLKDTIDTKVKYKVVKKNKDNDDEVVTKRGTFCNPVQGVYRDADGQYKYSEQAVGTEVTRSRTWTTEF